MFIFLHPNLAGRNDKDSHCAPGIHAGRARAGKSSNVQGPYRSTCRL